MSEEKRDELINSGEADFATAHELLAREYMDPDGRYRKRCDLPTHLELVNWFEQLVQNTPIDVTFFLYRCTASATPDPYYTVEICGFECEITDDKRLPPRLIYEVMSIVNNYDHTEYQPHRLTVWFRKGSQADETNAPHIQH